MFSDGGIDENYKMDDLFTTVFILSWYVCGVYL
jgi:hypothetical protein